MCTSISYRKKDLYFGRNLDLEFSYHEQVVITPRNHLFHLRNGEDFYNKYALIGIATVIGDYPLYYEASNEKGLVMAGLNFPGNACYLSPKEGAVNVTPFEFIPWLLGQAETIMEIKELLQNLNLTNVSFAKELPLSPLHFMISDQTSSIVIEPMEDGLHIYDNPYDVMTNNPPFEYHLWNINNYRNLTPHVGTNNFSSNYELQTYCVGMGAIGLPGDASSASRFVRAAFHLTNAPKEDTEDANVTQVFHILDSVSMLKGSTLTQEKKNDMTLYSCCINASKGIFYYKTYDNSQIHAVYLDHVDLNSDGLSCYDLKKEQRIHYQN